MEHDAFEMWSAICLLSMIAVPVLVAALMAAIEIMSKVMDFVDWLRG